MASVIDEFDEYERCSRAFSPIRARPFNISHDDCSSLQEKQRLQAKMRLRASFKSEHAYRSKKKQLDEIAQNMTDGSAQNVRLGNSLKSKTHTRESVTGVFDSSEEIDCDFPSGDDTASDDDLDDVNITSFQSHTPKGCPSPVRIRVGSPSLGQYNSRTPTTPSPQTHHHRSKSCRVRSRQPREKQFVPRDEVRQRTYSMPSRSRRPKLVNRVEEVSDNNDEEEDVYLVRTFSTSAKGIINRGDSLKKKPLSAQSSLDGSKSISSTRQLTTASNASQVNNMGSTTSLGHLEDPYSVFIIGSGGVGKASLIRQFMSSEYMGNTENAAVADNDSLPRVSILLDGAESTLEFTKLNDADDLGTTCCVDAFVVVFAVNDRDSFDDAVMCLHELRKKALLDKTATILVANKGDIVRGRDIEEEEAKKMAVRYGCKYIEVSAIINVKVDELLVGILKQIQLKDQNKERPKKHKKTTCVSDDSGCIPQPRSIVKKIFCKHPREFRSCDNLLVL